MRTSETNAGDLVADALLASVHADFAVIHAGAFHSDVIFPKVYIGFVVHNIVFVVLFVLLI